MKIGIVGYGFVGKGLKKLFPEAVVYDPAYADVSVGKEEINACDIGFICVPTQMLEDGSCDTSIVEETMTWLKTGLIIIRSTVRPGTTERLKKQYPDKKIVFQPEYVGESVSHPYADESNISFLIFGGDKADCSKAVELYQKVYNSTIKISFLTPTEAELAKYMTSCAIGSMVTLSNEFYNVCKTFGADYNVVREAFLQDPRMSRYFTFVYPNERGFGGKCIPKDMNAINKAAQDAGYESEFLGDVIKNNDRLRN